MAKPVRHYGKWRIRWVDAEGKRRSAVHDTYREAEHDLRRREVEAEEIRRGIRSGVEHHRRFDELADYWLTHRASRKRSAKDDRSILRVHLLPAFGGLPLREITTKRVDAFRAEKSTLADKTVSNILTLLIAMLNQGVELGWLAKPPKIRKPRVVSCEEDFKYLRDPDEIQRFLAAAYQEDAQTHVLYATALYTGLRQGELAGLRWADVDFERRMIQVARSFDGPTKSGRTRHVPILDPLLPILRGWRLRAPGLLVFANRDGRMFGRSARAFQEVLHRALKRAGFPERTGRGGRVERHIVFHSLRHTFASHWVMGGGDIFRLQRILGHQSIAMTMRYAHLAPDAFEGDYGRLGPAAPDPTGRVFEFRQAGLPALTSK